MIKPGSVANYGLVIPSLQYFQLSLTDAGSANYIVGNDVELSIIKLPHSKTNGSDVRLSFTISADSDRQAVIIQNNAVVWEGTLNNRSRTINIKVSLGYPLKVHNQRSGDLTYLTISKLLVTE